MKKTYISKAGRTGSAVLSWMLFAFLPLFTSCSDFLEEYSQDMARVQTVTDLDELLTGDCLLPLGYVSTAYSTYSLSNHNFDIVHFMGDELQENLETYYPPYNSQYYTPTYYPYFTWQQSCFLNEEGRNSNKSDEASYWLLGYEKIGKCNMVIDAADDMAPADEDDEALLNQVKGECHFLRANYYFMLANLYAKPYAPSTAASTPGIPLKTSAEIEDIEFQRSSVMEVYNQIVDDLNVAEQLLAQVVKPKNKYRVGILAVYIFRSRVAAFMQNWSEAADYARKALALDSSLQDLRNWNDGYPISAESAEVVFSNGSSCFGNTIFLYPNRANRYGGEYTYAPTYTISDHLLSLYDRNDARIGAYITNKDDISNRCWSYKKINNSTTHFNTYNTASDVFCLRTAEAYLLLAEAEAQMGNDAEACRQLNLLRNKRIEDAEDISLSGASLITFIREERERELCLEGHRWFDLRRYQVDAQYPYSTTIEHTFTFIKLVDDVDVRDHTNYYRLEPNDEAYTLDIPKQVRDHQVSIGSNPRPYRQPFKVVTEYDEDDDY